MVPETLLVGPSSMIETEMADFLQAMRSDSWEPLAALVLGQEEVTNVEDVLEARRVRFATLAEEGRHLPTGFALETAVAAASLVGTAFLLEENYSLQNSSLASLNLACAPEIDHHQTDSEEAALCIQRRHPNCFRALDLHSEDPMEGIADTCLVVRSAKELGCRTEAVVDQVATFDCSQTAVASETAVHLVAVRYTVPAETAVARKELLVDNLRLVADLLLYLNSFAVCWMPDPPSKARFTSFRKSIYFFDNLRRN